MLVLCKVLRDPQSHLIHPLTLIPPRLLKVNHWGHFRLLEKSVNAQQNGRQSIPTCTPGDTARVYNGRYHLKSSNKCDITTADGKVGTQDWTAFRTPVRSPFPINLDISGFLVDLV